MKEILKRIHEVDYLTVIDPSQKRLIFKKEVNFDEIYNRVSELFSACQKHRQHEFLRKFVFSPIAIWQENQKQKFCCFCNQEIQAGQTFQCYEQMHGHSHCVSNEIKDIDK